MTRVRLTLLGCLAVMAASAMAASAASAAEFEETVKAAHNVTGKTQKLTAEGLEGTKIVVTCTKVKGVATFSKTELTGTPEYEECNIAGKTAKVTVACKIGTTNTGLVNIGKGEGAKTCFTIETNDKSCKLIIKGEQLSLKEVVYKNNGTSLITEAKVKGIKFESSTGKACGFKNEAADGSASYEGTTETTGINIK